MALIAALLPEAADRSALSKAASGHRIVRARDWRGLVALVKREPVQAAVADLHAEPGKDGALRVLRFARRYPRTPLLVWGDLSGRDLFRLGKCGAFDVMLAPDISNGALVAERLGPALDDAIARGIDEALRARVGEAARGLVRSATSAIADGIQVPELAVRNDFSISTLERRCADWGLTSPGRILLWVRIIYGLHWLTEPGRSVESVAGQVGYSSGAAFRRAIKSTLAGGPTPLRKRGGVDRAVAAFAADCPGDPAVLAPAG